MPRQSGCPYCWLYAAGRSGIRSDHRTTPIAGGSSNTQSAPRGGHPRDLTDTLPRRMSIALSMRRQKLNQPMTALEFYRVLAPAVAALKCRPHCNGRITGHPARFGIVDSVNPPRRPDPQGKDLRISRLPPGGELAGAEIQSVNGVPASKLLATMLAVDHGDGDTPTAGPFSARTWRLRPRPLSASGHRESVPRSLLARRKTRRRDPFKACRGPSWMRLQPRAFHRTNVRPCRPPTNGSITEPWASSRFRVWRTGGGRQATGRVLSGCLQ